MRDRQNHKVRAADSDSTGVESTLSAPVFFADSVALFSGEKFAHMGVHQYSDHAGMRHGRSMSGQYLWAEADVERMELHRQGKFNKAGLEIDLLQEVATTIGAFVPAYTDVIELGPGTLNAFHVKTLPILKAQGKHECLIVDSSAAFLKNILMGQGSMNLDITAIEDDFFLSKRLYHAGQNSALLCSFGGTISNLIAPQDTAPPRALLAATLKTFAEKINAGWLLVSFDSDANADEVIDYYRNHADFQLNVFYRMAVELPIEGDFDPDSIDYVPVWIPSSRQLAHCAETRRELLYRIGPHSFRLPKKTRLHFKNSFKFEIPFFEACCADASLVVEHHWSALNSHVYLLRIASDQAAGAGA